MNRFLKILLVYRALRFKKELFWPDNSDRVAQFFEPIPCYPNAARADGIVCGCVAFMLVQEL